MVAQGFVQAGRENYQTITTKVDLSHYEYTMCLENSSKTKLRPLKGLEIIATNPTLIEQQLAYELVDQCHPSESQNRDMYLTIKELIDKSLELGSLAGLFDILSKNKQLDKQEVVNAILSRITDQKLEQLTQEKIKSYSKSVDGYLGVTTDAQKKDSFIKAINGKREESMQRILFGDRNNNNVSENIELFKTSIMTSLTKEQVVELLLNPSKEDKEIEIKELNQLLPQALRVAEVQNDVQKKKIIEKALDFLGFEKGYLSTTVKSTEEEKPKTSVWGCCAQPSVSNEELVVGGR